MYKKRNVKSKRPYRKVNKRPRKIAQGSSHYRGQRSLTYHPGTIRSPLPMEYNTKFIASAFMYSTSGVGTGDYIFNFKLNSMYLPFANAAPSGVTYNTINNATFQPPGFSTLLTANTYTKFLVRSTLFEFDVVNQSVLDPCTVTATCSKTGSVPVTVAAALTRPWTKQMQFMSGRTYKLGDYPLKMYVPIHKYVGIPRMMYEYDQSGRFQGAYNADAGQTFEIVVNCETGDNQVLASPLEFRVRITYYVSLTELATEQLP